MINFWFSLGLTYNEIVSCHNLKASGTSKRTYPEKKDRAINKYKRKNKSLLIFVSKFFLKDDMQNGFWWMHQWCLLAGYWVSRLWETVELKKNPEKTSSQRALCQGVLLMEACRFVWQIKTNGTCINSCIDGYTMKIILL